MVGCHSLRSLAIVPFAALTPRAGHRLASCSVVASAAPHSRVLASAEDTLELGGRLAELAQPGDTVLLCGDYGAGKTCLARGFLQHWFDSPDELVTSPSYLIDNVYPDDGRARCRGVTVHHMDLWRLPEGKIDKLVDLPSVYAECVSLIEWPERLGSDLMPREHLTLSLTIDASDTAPDDGAAADAELEDDQPRIATFVAQGARWSERLPALLA
eukprot:5756654-Prymnesium_polylepis.1